MGIKTNNSDTQNVILQKIDNCNSNLILTIMVAQCLITAGMIAYYYTSLGGNIDEIYGIHDKTRTRLQVFQNMFNFETIVNSKSTHEIIMPKYNAFVQGAWTYLKHIAHLLKHEEKLKVDAMQWDQENANKIKQEVAEKMEQIQNSLKDANSDTEQTQKITALQQLIAYANEIRPERFADMIAMRHPNKEQVLVVQAIHDHYNKIIKLPHVTTFLSILDEAHNTIMSHHKSKS